jgi:hypothetical protein
MNRLRHFLPSLRFAYRRYRRNGFDPAEAAYSALVTALTVALGR